MKKRMLLTALALSLAGPAFSAGGEPFDFLSLDAGARAVGMGGAYTALARDSSALLYNPGGLGRVETGEVAFMHNEHVQSVTQEYLSYVSARGFGLSLNTLKFDGVPVTTVAQPGGTGENAGLQDLALSGGYGVRLGDSLSAGVAVKYLHESIAGSAAQGLAVDFGVLAGVPAVHGLSLGAALQNLGPSVTFQDAKESLPFNARAGAAYESKVLGRAAVLSLDVSKGRSADAETAVGLEVRALQDFPIRFGYTTANKAGLGISAGFGCVYKSASIDYAFVPYGELGSAHRLSLTWRFAR